LPDARARLGVMLGWRAWRAGGGTWGGKPTTGTLGDCLNDPDPDVRFMAAKWVSDEKLAEFRPQIVDALKSPDLDPRAVIAYSTALARIDDKPVNEDALAAYFLDRLAGPKASAAKPRRAPRGHSAPPRPPANQ